MGEVISLRCLITDCLHAKSAGAKGWGATSWNRWQVCPCCAIVLGEIGVIVYAVRRSTGCYKYLAKELGKIGVISHEL